MADHVVPDLGRLSDAQLKELVVHTKHQTKARREEAACRPTTRAYLQAAMNLIGASFSEDSRRNAAGDEVENSWFKWLSVPNIARATDISSFDDYEQLSALDDEARSGRLADRIVEGTWISKRNFLADVLAVGLAIEHWSSPTVHSSPLMQGLVVGDLAAGIHAIAYDDLLQVSERDLTSFRLELIAIANAQRDEVLRDALKRGYQTINAEWAALYEKVLTAYGRRMRDGLTTSDLANMLTATAEGFALRLLTDPESSVRDTEAKTSLLGTMAMSIFIAATTNNDEDHATVEDIVRLAAASDG